MDQQDVAKQPRDGDSGGFRAVLAPNRSLSPRGFLILMTVIGTVSFISGMVFALRGAWPVLGFFGLDVLLVYVAFRLNYRSGRLREVVAIEDDKLVLSRISPAGRASSVALNPYWVRVVLEEGRHGVVDIKLVSHGRAYRVGAFLSEDEKRDFGLALSAALHAYRGGTRI